MTSLEELGKHYGTDKVYHRYLPHYEQWFSHLCDSEITLCEIGVLRGASLRMWRDYFKYGTIYGIDIEPSRAFQLSRLHVLVGSQNDTVFLDRAKLSIRAVDIVIDDGSHQAADQTTSFHALWPIVKPDGWYCVEDCHLMLKDGFNNKGSDPTLINYVSNRLSRILAGRSPIKELHIIGEGHKSGLIAMRKR